MSIALLRGKTSISRTVVLRGMEGLGELQLTKFGDVL